MQLLLLYKHKDKTGGVYSVKTVTVGGGEFTIKRNGTWKKQEKFPAEEKGLVYYDYIAVLKHGTKDLVTKASNPMWQPRTRKLVKMPVEQTFNSSCEVVR